MHARTVASCSCVNRNACGWFAICSCPRSDAAPASASASFTARAAAAAAKGAGCSAALQARCCSSSSEGSSGEGSGACCCHGCRQCGQHKTGSTHPSPLHALAPAAASRSPAFRSAQPVECCAGCAAAVRPTAAHAVTATAAHRLRRHHHQRRRWLLPPQHHRCCLLGAAQPAGLVAVLLLLPLLPHCHSTQHGPGGHLQHETPAAVPAGRAGGLKCFAWTYPRQQNNLHRAHWGAGVN